MFRTDAQLELDGSALLARINRQTGNAFVGYAGRVMSRKDTNQDVGFANGFIGNQSRVTTASLQGLVDGVTSSWQSRQSVPVANRGIALLGVDQGDFAAALAVDSFMILVYANSSDNALNAIKIIGANLGVTVAGGTVAPPTTVAVAPPPTVPPTPPPAPPSAAADFGRMFAPRDAYAFQIDASLDTRAAQLLTEINQASNNAFIASAARSMYRVDNNRTVALVFGYVADKNRISPPVLQSTALSVARDFADRKVLKVDRGVAIAGTERSNSGQVFGVAEVAFDNYLFEVIADTRQSAQDAAFVVATNLGARLTE